MKKSASALLIAIGLLSAFAVNFYQKSPTNPQSNLSTLSPRQLELINQPPLPPDTKIDKLIVYKSKREMHALSDGSLVKIYPISLGKNPIGHKEFEGDKKTPRRSLHHQRPQPKQRLPQKFGHLLS